LFLRKDTSKTCIFDLNKSKDNASRPVLESVGTAALSSEVKRLGREAETSF
jgi:hypothetical protein